MTDKTCSLVLLKKGDDILLAMKKRGFGANLWNGVGGKIEPGETIEQALVRETQEEIGVTPLEWRKVAEHDFVMDADSDKPWHMFVHAYICSQWQGEPAESEEMAPRWFKINEIPYDEMWQDDIVWLPQVLKGKQLRGKFTFDHQDNMMGAEFAFVTDLQ